MPSTGPRSCEHPGQNGSVEYGHKIHRLVRAFDGGSVQSVLEERRAFPDGAGSHHVTRRRIHHQEPSRSAQRKLGRQLAVVVDPRRKRLRSAPPGTAPSEPPAATAEGQPH